MVLAPAVISCATSGGSKSTKTTNTTKGAAGAGAAQIPLTRPSGWDPIAYNRQRGNAGAIPKSYLPDINGPDGVKKHLGKHLPYIPKVDAAQLPDGVVALMWGDPAKGYARHPNAPRDPAKSYRGHWYDWIELRKAVPGAAEELRSSYADWPGDDAAREKYLVYGGGEITGDSGKNTIYLAALPKDVQRGDLVRVWAHCLYHGEYVDFITV